MIQDGGETGEALGGRYSLARAALRLCLTSLTVAATLYLIIKSGCRDLPDACARASAYVPGWAYGEYRWGILRQSVAIGSLA